MEKKNANMVLLRKEEMKNGFYGKRRVYENDSE